MTSEPSATVCVVDDDASVRKATSRLFRAAGFHVLTFADAQTFLDHRPPEGPACLILDLQMPGLDGIELQEELVSRDIELPIVFMTGHGDIPTTVKAMKTGAVDFLPKPVDNQQLLETVRSAIQDHALTQQLTSGLLAFRNRVRSLTQREHEVMLLVISGLLNKQIARRLGITETTVKVHRGRVMEKTEAGSVAELARLCERAGLAPPSD